MADEVKVNPEPTPESKPSESTPVVPPNPATPPANVSPKSKTNKALVAFIILLFLIVGSGSFFAGRVTAPQSPTPTPSVAENEQDVPTVEPTEAPTPTVEVTEAVSPTTVQQATPTLETPTQTP